MKESHSEGVANRTGSESCGGPREGPAEALTGERCGAISIPTATDDSDSSLMAL
jgi:hypothetical protein